ncbi:sensor histidine kinase [Paenibacillus kyungheensis]|uniref:Sensor histidine kinase n=1 Tax=Paenibacillus kyungheensis TaxID=1452732 RepID=A0AAX3M5Z1_9BACL|nr:sensor histidine kinase [Paenibacillus kyungheensis]WCT56939.1 sensor histidine kinase [Paenibacillus kyungheensis]
MFKNKSISLIPKASIKVKIAVLFIVLITLSALLSNGILYFVFMNIMREQLLEDQQNIMLQSRSNVQNVENSIDQATYYFSTDKTIADILNKTTFDDIESYRDLNTINQQFIKYLDVPLSNVVSTYSATFFVKNTFPVAAELPTIQLEQLNKLPGGTGSNRFFNSDEAENEEWFKRTVELSGTLNIFYADQDRDRVYFAKQVRNPLILNTTNEMGVIVIAIDTAEFGKQIEASRLTQGTQLLLADQNNQVLYSNNPALKGVDISHTPDLAPVLQYTDIGGTSDLKYNQTQYIADTYPLKWGWNLIALIPYSDITDRLSIIFDIIVGITVAVIVAGISFTLLLSNSIAKPVITLANVMRNIKDGSTMDVFIEPPEQDEVGVLYRQFNNLMKRINGLVDDVIESGERERQAEMKALQAQINPHFIYNTLDSINWMALSKNEEDIVTMVSSLAHILRYSIKQPNEQVPLRQEIEHVQNYVNIQSLRYGDNFDISYDIEPELYDYLLPKFIIQPLIENAILHGTEQIADHGNIVLRAYTDGIVVRIIVEDNGPGADTELLNDYLDREQEVLHSSDGIGISNIHQRIKLHYADEMFGLRFYYTDNVMKSVITIPYKVSKKTLTEKIST